MKTERSTQWGNNLRRFLKAGKMPVSQLSEMTGIEYNRLLRICRGSEAYIDEAVYISRALELDPRSLYDDEETGMYIVLKSCADQERITIKELVYRLIAVARYEDFLKFSLLVIIIKYYYDLH